MKEQGSVFMNKFCVIARNKETYFINRLIKEVGQRVQLFDPWSDIDFPQTQNYLVRTTGVHHSDLDLLFLKSLPPKNVFNSLEALIRFRSKSSQYTWFDEMNFPCLPWLSLNDVEPLTAEKFFALYPEVVVKPDIGQGGWGVEVLTKETFKSWMKKHDKHYLLQPFIKGARELRYFFILNNTAIVLERKAKTGIAANFRKEGHCVLSSLPPEFQGVVDDLVQQSGADYGAIDLLIHDKRLSILELNTVPGIEQLEQVSGHNIIKLLISGLSL
jgi:glutathione synthase/RimK-type ligase-like ATP-grasp enzyme